MSTNTAWAKWQGGLKDGQGHLKTNSKTLQDAPYDFKTRFEGAEGTNPEELIAAAHAGCFSMALSNILGEDGIIAESIETKADVILEKLDEGPRITKIHLSLNLKAPGADENTLKAAAEKAKQNCPISKLLKAEITLTVNVVT